MFDVLYLDRTRREKVLASGLARDVACELARQEACSRDVGRMFLAGSERAPLGEMILIVETQRQVA
ncbi:MAG: hypothetical protein EXQ70_09965 [Solirubrobacterales bacterium]|nr:hypothetical protein [Solirubrobacterales bacterium]